MGINELWQPYLQAQRLCSYYKYGQIESYWPQENIAGHVYKKAILIMIRK